MTGCADKLVVHGTTCRDIQIVCLAVMSVSDMTASALCRAAAGTLNGKAFKCCAVGTTAVHLKRLG